MKVAGLDLDGILQILGSLVEGETKIPDRDVQKLLVGMYTEATGSFTPIVRAAPALAEPVSRDLTPIIATLLNVVGNVGNSAEVQEALASIAKARAIARKASLDEYVLAGFTKAQAFQLVLEDSKKGLPSIPAGLNTSSSSKDS